MSTVIVITPPKKPPSVAERSDGSTDIVEEDGLIVATFTNKADAIAYLKVISKE